MFTEKLTHDPEAKAVFLEQFKDKANLYAMVASYVAQVQEIESVFYDILTARALDTAEGDRLDQWGSVVGQARNGRDDDTYRLWIKGQIRANLSSGTTADLLTIVRLLVPEAAARVTYSEQYPASYLIEIADALGIDVAQLAQILAPAGPAGVGGSLLYANVADELAFSFAPGDDEASALENAGFEDGDVGWTKDRWTIENDGANARSGSWVGHVTPGAQSIMFRTAGDTSTVLAVAGDKVYAQAWFKGQGGGNGSGVVSVSFFDINSVFISAVIGNLVAGSVTSYTLSSVAATAPANTAYARVGVTRTVSTLGDMWVDDIVLGSLQGWANDAQTTGGHMADVEVI